MIAADIMTRDVQTIRTNASITHALDLMQSLDVRHLPVVNENDELVGILSDRDLRSLLTAEESDEDDTGGASLRTRQAVSSVMSENVAALNGHVDLDGILDRLVDEKVGALPVVDEENKVIGIVSYIDVLQVWRRWRTDGAVGDIPDEPAPPRQAAPAKKAAPRKAAKKAVAKKAVAKKAVAKKAVAKKAVAKKPAAKKAAPRKGAAKKAAPKKGRGR